MLGTSDVRPSRIYQEQRSKAAKHRAAEAQQVLFPLPKYSHIWLKYSQI